MISAKLLTRNGTLCGFDISGHSGSAARGSDIVCAAVSSAAYMAANTLTEVCGCHAEIYEADGALRVTVSDPEQAQIVLKGLEIHLQGLVAQYPKFIKIQLTEV
jgi:uncharacterized protein YsxB (DUF464 family)